jgi:hypothetical protein
MMMPVDTCFFQRTLGMQDNAASVCTKETLFVMLEAGRIPLDNSNTSQLRDD